jgi:hypothetical protein
MYARCILRVLQTQIQWRMVCYVAMKKPELMHNYVHTSEVILSKKAIDKPPQPWVCNNYERRYKL